jgi:hypothetical protein
MIARLVVFKIALALPVLAITLGITVRPARAAPTPRFAVLVGANEASPGRKALLYGHRDADAMADVLASVGGFAPDDLRVLRDPSPQELLAAVEAGLAKLAGRPESLFVFYYSGHADSGALYPHGLPLPVDRLRRLLDDARVAVKIGMVDACRGGGWTRAKGLSREEPFAVHWPVTLGNEGSVLIASSSGVESAHESENLRGSFFTYHFAAGLRGAADRDGDGEVTLTEAFDYARDRTVRDTVRLAPEPQHPSYAVNLRGRHDLVLAAVAASPSTVEVEERMGPLELVHLDTGLQLLDLPSGRRQIKLAVPPGRYVLRRRSVTGVLWKEIVVVAGERNRVDEADLTLVGTDALVAKSITPAPTVVTAPAALVVTEVTVTPPPTRTVALWEKVAAVGTLSGAALSAGMVWYFSHQITSINNELEPHRRFRCPDTAAFTCDITGHPAPMLTDAERAWDLQQLDETARFQDLEKAAVISTVLFTVASAPFIYRWLRSDREPEPEQLAFVPWTSDAHTVGLTAFMRY